MYHITYFSYFEEVVEFLNTNHISKDKIVFLKEVNQIRKGLICLIYLR